MEQDCQGALPNGQWTNQVTMWKYSIIHLYFIFILRFINCCQCNTSMSHSHGQFEKRQLDLQEFSTTEFNVDDNTTAASTTPFDISPLTVNENSRDLNETYTELNYISEINDSITDFYDSSTEVNGSILHDIEYSDYNESTVISANETTTEENERKTTRTLHILNRTLKKKCRYFKKDTAFDLGKMADVWQVVYYRLPNQLKCFKLHIKVVKSKEQQHLAKAYGSFNNTVHWDRCNLEIKSSDVTAEQARRHFLQGTQNEKGVMDNIIIDEEHCQNTTYLTLHRESADQWLVIKNLLVMQDCDTGDLVVFSRVPLEPRRDDILDALMVFGENKANGTMACQEKSDKPWLKYEETAISQPLTYK